MVIIFSTLFLFNKIHFQTTFHLGRASSECCCIIATGQREREFRCELCAQNWIECHTWCIPHVQRECNCYLAAPFEMNPCKSALSTRRCAARVDMASRRDATTNADACIQCSHRKSLAHPLVPRIATWCSASRFVLSLSGTIWHLNNVFI